jgi:hypothetical protein
MQGARVDERGCQWHSTTPAKLIRTPTVMALLHSPALVSFAWLFDKESEDLRSEFTNVRSPSRRKGLIRCVLAAPSKETTL